MAAALDLDFDKSNAEFVSFYDRCVQPLAEAGTAVVMLDNIGPDPDARKRSKGASAKQDRADLTFSSALRADPVGLILTCRKVRTVRAPFGYGDMWLFDRDSQQITPYASDEHKGGKWRPTGLMQKASILIEETPGLGKREIRDRINSKADHVDAAIDALIAEAYVERVGGGPGQKGEHHSIRPYREGAGWTAVPNRVPTVSRGVSRRTPATVRGDRVPRSGWGYVYPPLSGHGPPWPARHAE